MIFSLILFLAVLAMGYQVCVAVYERNWHSVIGWVVAFLYSLGIAIIFLTTHQL